MIQQNVICKAIFMRGDNTKDFQLPVHETMNMKI